MIGVFQSFHGFRRGTHFHFNGTGQELVFGCGHLLRFLVYRERRWYFVFRVRGVRVRFIPFLYDRSPVIEHGRATAYSVSYLSMLFRPLTRLLRALCYRYEGFSIELEASIRRGVNVLTNDLRRVVGRYFNELVILINGLVPPRPVRHFADFRQRIACVLSKRPYHVLAQRIAFRSLGVLANGEHLVVVVSSRAPQLRLVGRDVLFKRFPVGIFVLVLVPPTIRPSDACKAMIYGRFHRLIVRGLVVTFPISF